MGGQLLESSQENNVESTRAEEQSSHGPKQIRCLVEMHRFLRWNMGHFKQNASSTRQRRNLSRKLEYKAVSNPAPGNKLIIMNLIH